MLRTPVLWGNKITIEGDDTDAYLRELPDDAPFHDGVLELLGELVKKKRNSCSIVDVGANVGIHSIALASLGPGVDVVAVEANPRTATWLQHNADRNGAKLRVVQRAISDEPGSLSFCDNHEFAAGSMPLAGAPAEFVDFLKARDDATHEVIEVPAVRLDDLVPDLGLTSLDILKIDVEGHDIRVVRGARETIERFKPVVIMEFATLAISLHAGMLPSDVLREVRQQFADVYVVREDGRVNKIATDADAIGFLEGNAVRSPVQDLVCVPAGSPLAAAVAARVSTDPARTRDDILHAAGAQLSDAQRKIEELTRERDEARAHAANLERTLSWKVTAPLRAVRRQVDAVRARRAAAK